MNNLIQSDPSIMMGKPIIAGTRITVELILEKLAAGESVEQILDAYPRLTKEAVLAALDFAAKVLKADVIYPVPEKAA
jgi:uncharacterized protein (DUF433 family)